MNSKLIVISRTPIGRKVIASRASRSTRVKHHLGATFSSPSTSISTSYSTRPNYSSNSTPSTKQAVTPSNSPKVVTLPFRLSSEVLDRRIPELAVVTANQLHGGILKNLFALLARKLTKSLGIDGAFGLENGTIQGEIRKVRERAIYLPTWVVDSNFEMRCTGDDGRATASFVTMNSRFPGHSWISMHSFPIRPPQPEQLDSTFFLREAGLSIFQDFQKSLQDGFSQSRSSALASESKTDEEPKYPPLKYELWSRKDHLNPQCPKGEKVLREDLKIDLLEFTSSPVRLEQIIRGIKGDELEVSVSAGNAVRNEKSNEPSSSTTTFKFDPTTLKVDLLACYPVLMPIHLVQFEYNEPGGDGTEILTFGLGGWSEEVEQIVVKVGEDGEWIRAIFPMMKGESPLDLSPPFFFPKSPVIDRSLQERGEQKGTLDLKTGIRNHMFSEGIIGSLVQRKIETSIKNLFQNSTTFWNLVEKSSTPKIGIKHPNNEEGKIDWKDIRIQRLDKDPFRNRQYLTSVNNCWNEKRQLTGIELLSNFDYTSVTRRKSSKGEKGEGEGGKEEMETLSSREIYLESIKRMENSKPDWSKEFQKTFQGRK